jgi:tonB family C-terminal domain
MLTFKNIGMKRTTLLQMCAGIIPAIAKRLILIIGIASATIPAYTASSDFLRQKSAIALDTLTSQTMPEFPGGIKALFEYLKIKIELPIHAIECGIPGRVIVSFTVDENGKVKSPHILRGVDPRLDTMALERVQQMPQWKPATENGKAVPHCGYTVPVYFIIDYIPYEEYIKNKQQ